MHLIRQKLPFLILCLFSCLFCLSGCHTSSPPTPSSDTPVTFRDNTPVCYIPSADGKEVRQNEFALLDISNVSEGYIMVQYTGSSEKVKLQIVGSDQITYTYDLTSGQFDSFPLSSGSGQYEVGVYENVAGNQYSLAFSEQFSAEITNTFGPFLYSNQYVVFDSSSAAVKKAMELAESAVTDLDVVSSVYLFVTSNISYDYEKAAEVSSGYTPVADETLASQKGICLDFASLMTCMLRSQNIPTRLEVGYAGENYHAWISTYIEDIGWVNGIIHFDGKTWQIMDPTYAATGGEETLKSFMENENNYVVKYRY